MSINVTTIFFSIYPYKETASDHSWNSPRPYKHYLINTFASMKIKPYQYEFTDSGSQEEDNE